MIHAYSFGLISLDCGVTEKTEPDRDVLGFVSLLQELLQLQKVKERS